jgi:hypothetical protein
MDPCDHSKQGLESEIVPETQNDPESEVTDVCVCVSGLRLRMGYCNA